LLLHVRDQRGKTFAPLVLRDFGTLLEVPDLRRRSNPLPRVQKLHAGHAWKSKVEVPQSATGNAFHTPGRPAGKRQTPNPSE
jgi:hypothetical protein